jgi:hypothetical protein
MIITNLKKPARHFLRAVGVSAVLAVSAMAQTGGGTVFRSNNHLSFDRPEAWGLKYFASASLLTGLAPAESSPEHRVWSVTAGVELGWLPALSAGQQRIGFNGTTPEDLNQAPLFARAVVKVGLPDKFSAIIAAAPPFRMFDVTAHLLALGLERPIVERDRWKLGWRAYGQVGSVKGAFTCPTSVLGFAPGSPENPTTCVGESADVASLRYFGAEIQYAYRIPGLPKLVPHATAGANLIDGVFQTHAPIRDGLDETRLWTRGATFSTSGGVSYLVTKRAAFTVDVFYSPLWVRRDATAPRTNDGLFNVRAFLSYTFH